jgi:hypothetical protein
MKKSAYSLITLMFILVSGLFILGFSVKDQESTKASEPLPQEVSLIVTSSCVPCHTSTGGLLSKAKLNFTEWTNYSADIQKKKAASIYSMLKKGAMPPKEAREANPDIIPSKKQIDIIKKWSQSF